MTEDVNAERIRLMAKGNDLTRQAHEFYETNRINAALRRWHQIKQISDRYRELLPEVPVARSPDSGEVVTWPIDTYGLDGWFWSYLTKIRRFQQRPPLTWLAMTGAMRLTDPVENTPYKVVPGPGVPFVLPYMLERPGTRAVIAEVPVGAHTGWAISYFGPMPDKGPLADTWGANSHEIFWPDGRPTSWSSYSPRASECDFDLTPWLRSKSLLWIEPGDGSMTLREGPDECPFVDLAGPRRYSIICDGQVRYDDVPPAE